MGAQPSFVERRKEEKEEEEEAPKASSGHGRRCDHAAPVPAVFAAREREGASDSVHRQTLEPPAAPQRQVLTVQTVQVFGDFTLQFLGEVVDAPVVATTGLGMVQTVQTVEAPQLQLLDWFVVLPVVVQDKGYARFVGPDRADAVLGQSY